VFSSLPCLRKGRMSVCPMQRWASDSGGKGIMTKFLKGGVL
jgi:hypothetical protein